MTEKQSKVPFNKPSLSGDELSYIQQAIEFGQLSGDGEFTIRCQNLIEQRGVTRKALLTHSCTAALEMAMILVGIEKGDEVIMPSYTFVSTANAVCLRGGVPVFVDIDESSLCLDHKFVEAAITDKTKAVVMVHYAGFIDRVEEIQGICERHGLYLIEDAAQAMGSTYKGKPAGSFGDLSAFSFHETKNIISGEGGVLGVNNPSMTERAEIIREKGTNRSKFFRGQVDKYTWVDIGSSFLPGELIAAFLFAQLENINALNARRLEIWKAYNDFFISVERSECLCLPMVPDQCEHNGHMYFVMFESKERREEFIGFMKSQGVMTPFHYVPLHSSPAGKDLSRASGSLEVTNKVSDRLVRLPLYIMSEQSHSAVMRALNAFFN